MFHLHFDRCGSLVGKGLGYPATSQDVAAFLRRSFASGSENAGSTAVFGGLLDHGRRTTDYETICLRPAVTKLLRTASRGMRAES